MATSPPAPSWSAPPPYYARKEDYAKAAHAALYSGFVQQHYDEKEAAMRSFKEAEKYGMMAGDSLTMARAEYMRDLTSGVYTYTVFSGKYSQNGKLVIVK